MVACIKGRYAQWATCVLVDSLKDAFQGYRMPESLSAFCNIVSFTAAKTNRMFDVSVACVKLQIVSAR